ncbi:uncharacterized protein [Macrobrachium rosenbergii]|uniref:uncharacterized protein n=1 Tax=Macrobrachium rosenbergii TaxID=79674 RepID=UPI0034D4A19A
MKLHQTLLLRASLVCVLFVLPGESWTITTSSYYYPTYASTYTWSTIGYQAVNGSWSSSSSSSPPPPTTVETYQSFEAGEQQCSVELGVTPSVMSDTVAAIVPPSLLEAVHHDPTIRFVTSPTYGPFFMAFGVTVPVGEAKVTVSLPDACSCKVSCSSASWCVAASGVKMSNGSVTCYLADHLPATNNSESSTAFYLFFDRVTDKFDVYTIRGNNEIYVVSRSTHPFTKASDFCNSLPGFRLAISITKPEVDVLLGLLEVVGADMNVAVTRAPETMNDQWADGTKFDDSYLHYYHNKDSRSISNPSSKEPYYRLKVETQKIQDSQGDPFRTLCQGYLFS